MENHFLVDSEFLSPQALARKHQLETDPSSRKSHMEYLPGMEQLQSDIRDKVIGQMESYDPARYTAWDVRAALDLSLIHISWTLPMCSAVRWRSCFNSTDRAAAQANSAYKMSRASADAGVRLIFLFAIRPWLRRGR